MPQARFIGKPRSQTSSSSSSSFVLVLVLESPRRTDYDDEDGEFHRCSSPVALCAGLRRAENRV